MRERLSIAKYRDLVAQGQINEVDKSENMMAGNLIKPMQGERSRKFCIIEMVVLIVCAMTFSVFFSLSFDVKKYGLLMFAGLIVFVVYLLYISPVLIHNDPNSIRGLGEKKEWFIRRDNLKSASKNYAIMLFFVSCAIITAAYFKGMDLSDPVRWKAFLFKLTFYFSSAFIQSLCFLGFFLVRLQKLIPGENDSWKKTLQVSAAATVVFAIFHIPNTPLMVLTSGIGFMAATIFQRTPNIVPAFIAHAVIGALFHRVLELNMRIGQAYWHPDKYFFREVIPGFKDLIGNTF